MHTDGAGRRPNKTCIVCGKAYHACKRCDELKNAGLLSWKANCDTPGCYQAYLVLSGYKSGEYSAKEAKQLLDRVLEDQMKPYEKHAEKLIGEIYRAAAE